MPNDHQIVPGVTVTATGEASVDPALAEVLFSLALHLEERTDLPVDVEHVLGAIVLAARNQEIDRTKVLESNDGILIEALIPHVQTVFKQYGGSVGSDD